MSFIKDDDGDFFRMSDHVFDGELNLAEELGFREAGFAKQGVVKLAVEIQDIDGSQGHIKALKSEIG